MTCCAVHKELSEIEETRKVIGKHLLQYATLKGNKNISYEKYPDYTPASYAFVNNMIEGKKDSSKYSEELKRVQCAYGRGENMEHYIQQLFIKKLIPKEYEPSPIPLHLIHEFSHNHYTMFEVCNKWFEIKKSTLKNYQTLLAKTEDLWHSLPLPRQLFLLHLIEEVMNKEKKKYSIEDRVWYHPLILFAIFLKANVYVESFSHIPLAKFLMYDAIATALSMLFLKDLFLPRSDHEILPPCRKFCTLMCILWFCPAFACSCAVVVSSPYTSVGLELYNALYETPEVKNLRLLTEHFKKKLKEAYL